MAKFPYPLMRHWLPSTLFVLCAIFTYTKSPLYGADPTPTPDVSTVPKPGQLFTPTPPPAPVIVIVTQEAPAAATRQATTNQPSNQPDNTNQAAPTAPNPNNSANGHPIGTSAPASSAALNGPEVTGVIVTAQVNLRQAPSTTAPIIATLIVNTPVTILGRTAAADWLYLCCGSQPPQPGWVSAPFVQVTGGDLLTLPVSTGNQPGSATMGQPTLALTAAITPTMIWQGAVVQLQLMVQNTSAVTLTHLTLRQIVPAALRYKSGASDQAGALHLTAAPGGDRQLQIEWAELPPSTVATAIVTLQVEPTTPNGLLFDSRAEITSKEGATATAVLTLAMPPVALPHFRK